MMLHSLSLLPILLTNPLCAASVDTSSSTKLWFNFCKKCDLESMRLFGPEMVRLKGIEDESCMTYCIGSDSVGHVEKMRVVDWLLRMDGTVDNETFSMVCMESSWNKPHDPEWEQFPLRLLAELEKDDEGAGQFDYGEALCHASFHGCVQTVRELLKKTHTANFEKIIGDIRINRGHNDGHHNYTPTTPLTEAILGNQVEVLEVLIGESDASFDNQSGTCPFSLALRAHNYNVADFLIKVGAPFDDSLIPLDISAEARQLLMNAKAYRERLCQTVENYLIFFVGNVETRERPEVVEKGNLEFIEGQLAKLEYSPLEVRTCLMSRHN